MTTDRPYREAHVARRGGRRARAAAPARSSTRGSSTALIGYLGRGDDQPRYSAPALDRAPAPRAPLRARIPTQQKSITRSTSAARGTS